MTAAACDGRRQGRMAAASTTRVRQVVAVTSCKGGVGKSTVSLELARTLAARGHRVGLLDADVHGPSLPTQVSLLCLCACACGGRFE
jgi:Mrp family chromosome partitioning ATPase